MFKNLLSLYRVLMADIRMDKATEKRRKRMVAVIITIVLLFVFIPVMVGSALLTFLMTKSLSESASPAFGIQLMYGLISIFTVMLGINVVFNELYFSEDIQHILPLPIKPWEIAGAKLLAVFMNENVIQFMLVLACNIGFCLAVSANPLMWIVSIAAGFTLSVAPTAACAIIGILMMRFSRLIHSKDTVRRISGIFMLIIAAFMVGALLSLSNQDLDAFIVSASAGDVAFVHVLKILFPQISMLSRFMASGNVLALLGYLAISLALVVLFLLIAQAFYVQSVTGLGEASHASSKAIDLSKTEKVRSIGRALRAKEYHILMRTNVFFTNCVAVTFIWPVFVIIAWKILGTDLSQEVQVARYRDGNSYSVLIMLFAMAITLVMASMNSLGSDAFSREGENFYFMRAIPLDLKYTWHAKAQVSMTVTSLGTIPFMLGFGIYIHMPIAHMIMMVLLQAAAAFFVTYLGMLLDSMNPKLVWEDVLSSLRENDNTFFCMAISILTAVFIGGGLFYISRVTAMSALLVGAIAFILLVIMDLILYHRAMTRGIQNLWEVGEV